MAVIAAETPDIKRFAKADLEAYVTGQFKTFCKEKCAECGGNATKRYATSMSFVVSKMPDSFWCNECGRILCEKCRYQHTCENLDRQKERNAKLTHEQLAQQMLEAEVAKEQKEEEKQAELRKAAEAAEQERVVRKDRRRILAQKAKSVEDFLQGITRDTDANAARGPAARDELLELYTRAARLALTLYNEFEHPTMQELAEEEWEDVKVVYERAKELSRMIVIDREGQPLNMQNPWDPPPPPSQDLPEAEGAGLGRGLL